MYLDFFTDTYFILSIALLLCSVYLFVHKKRNLSLIALTLSAFFLRYFMADLDPFLSEWDERFHALVARNMMDSPFKPMLRKDPIVGYEYTAWCCNHIWLHKQPLFLWQMALSMKIFGVSELTMRLPSVLLGALMTPLLYRVAFLHTKSKTLAYSTALFMCLSWFQLELISGYFGMDHNDLSFSFYVLASIWAYIEYINNKKLSWVVLIGVFAGCAILNKWLTGLLVYSAWIINIIVHINSKETRTELLHLLLSLSICLLIFLPWQLYILNAFPKEASFEFAYNSKHIFTPIEGHKGSNEFYFNHFKEYFGKFVWVFVLVGTLVSLVRRPLSKINLALLIYIAVVYIFFSLVAQTKLITYFFIVVPIGYVYMTKALQIVRSIPCYGNVMFTLLTIICCVFIFRPDILYAHHDPESEYRKARIHNTEVYKNIRNYIPKDVKIIQNASSMHDIDIMFYNNDINAYQYCFWPQDFEKEIVDKIIPIAAFKNRPGYTLPYYIKNYDHTTIINADIIDTSPLYR